MRKHRIFNLSERSEEEARKLINTTLEWCIKEQWNPYEKEFEIFYTLHKNNFHMMEIFNEEKDEWELCSQIFVPLNEETKQGNVGYFITREDLRRQGLGGTLWKETVGKVPKDYQMWLAGIIEVSEWYERSGFKNCGIINEHIFTDFEKFREKSSRCKAYSEMNENERKSVLNYAGRKVTPYFSKYLNLLLENKGRCVALVVEEEIKGIGIAKPLEKDWKYCWVVDDDDDDMSTVEEIFKDMNERFSILLEKVYLETKEKSKIEKWLVEKIGTKTHPYCCNMPSNPKARVLDSFIDLGYNFFFH